MTSFTQKGKAMRIKGISTASRANRNNTARLLLLCAACLCAFRAEAQLITPVSQSRSVLAATYGGVDRSDAANFGFFNASAFSSHFASPCTAYAQASQQSQVTNTSITASGAGSGTGSGVNPAVGDSSFSVSFTLDDLCTFTLTGSVAVVLPFSAQASASVDLSGPAGTIYSTPPGAGASGNPYNFSANGALLPGQYTLSAEGYGDASACSGASGTYDLTFTTSAIPGPSKFPQWQIAYFGATNSPAAAPSADPDGDGMSNTNEFLAGTSPTNRASVLRITSVILSDNDVWVTWLTAGGKTNVVQSAISLNGTYSDISPTLRIAGGGDTTTSYLDPGAVTNASARFYRIRLVR
jgi:hypothetical protein